MMIQSDINRRFLSEINDSFIGILIVFFLILVLQSTNSYCNSPISQPRLNTELSDSLMRLKSELISLQEITQKNQLQIKDLQHQNLSLFQEAKIEKQFIYIGFLFLFVFLVITAGIIYYLLHAVLQKPINQLLNRFTLLESAYQTDILAIHEREVQLLTHDVTYIQQYIEKLDNTLSALTSRNSLPGNKSDSKPIATEHNHELALKVAEELHRMKTRLMAMPEDTKGLSALKNALRRLEEKIADEGYDIIDLVGRPFIEGMNLEATFIPSEELTPGTQIITKVVRPQINFKGILLKSAKVEVSVGE